jgi:hypothetical protein
MDAFGTKLYLHSAVKYSDWVVLYGRRQGDPSGHIRIELPLGGDRQLWFFPVLVTSFCFHSSLSPSPELLLFLGCGPSAFPFEFGSSVAGLKEDALCGRSLTHFSIPASLQKVDISALMYTGIRIIAVERGNAAFRAGEDFLLNVTELSVLRYFAIGSGF